MTHPRSAVPLLLLAAAATLGACGARDDAPPDESTSEVQQAGITLPHIPLPGIQLPCFNVQRGSTAGDVADTWLLPYGYSTVNFGDNERITVTSLLGGPPSPSFARALLRFDIAPGALPPGAQVVSAEVVLTPIEPNATGALDVFTVNAPWQESTITQATFPTSGGYATPAIRTVPFSGMDKVRFDVTAEVIAWTTGAMPNRGLLFAPGPGATTAFRFSAGSSESERKPYLRVCYDPSPCVAQPNGTACQDASICTVGGTCQNGICVGVPAPAGTVCRNASGTCDVAETCTGSSTVCPVAKIAPAGTLCRVAAGACDVGETCNGAAAGCPADKKKDAGVQCRASAGACDVAESCDGTSAACPADAKKPSGSVCRAASDACDAAESCNGTSNDCPADGVAAAGTPCRGAAGACDVAEACTGSSKSCPVDKLAPAGTPCGKLTATTCDPVDVCSGTSPGCSAMTTPDGTSCGTGAVCDGGSCVSCGEPNEPCCGKTCNGNANCGDDGMCRHCGNSFEVCCDLTTCPGSTDAQPLRCNNAGSAFAKCGQCGNKGQPCCFGKDGGCNDGMHCTQEGAGWTCDP